MRSGLSVLDFKLGVRMLLKYPGVTFVGVLALTVATGIGAVWFQFTRSIIDPPLPLEQADRVVAIRNFDLETAGPDPRSLHDFESWRVELRSVEEIGAASAREYTMATEDGRSATVEGARITAEGLGIARVAPALGRPLLDSDVGGPPVVVIGYDLWHRLFDGDPSAVGRTLRMGTSTSTVVGVMPRGFGFPVNQEIWEPFDARAVDYERRAGPAIMVFGRLAPGVSLQEAQTELTALGQRAAAEFPATHERLRPRIEGYLGPFTPDGGLLLAAINVPILLLLLVICANVATLVFARTVAREGELVTRSALGASRARLIVQLFAEALVLTSTAAAVGLFIAAWTMERGMSVFWEVQGERPPFWVDDALSPSTILYTVALAVLSAVLVGVVPAIKATGRNLRLGLSGGSRLRFGALSTAVIVVQVAFCVIILPIAMVRGQDALGDRLESTGFPADEYLAGRIHRQGELPAAEPARSEQLDRSIALHEEVRRRLAEEPGVSGVAFTDRIPGMNHPYELVAVEELDLAARSLSVDLDFFELMEARIVSGRGFLPADLESGGGVAVVDETFVRESLGGRNPIGQRVSYPNRPGEEGERWYEVVGIVQDLQMNAYGPGGYQDLVQTAPAGYVGVYHPFRPGEGPSAQIFLRADAENPDALASHLAATIAGIAPSLAVVDLLPLDQVWRPIHRGERIITSTMAFIVLGALSLSAAGIYALVSFTVSQRTREIGIRTALGAHPRRIVLTIFSRALLQIGIGVLAGGILFTLATGVSSVRSAGPVLAMAALMMGVGFLACVVPARRALRIAPTEALRADI